MEQALTYLSKPDHIKLMELVNCCIKVDTYDDFCNSLVCIEGFSGVESVEAGVIKANSENESFYPTLIDVVYSDDCKKKNTDFILQDKIRLDCKQVWLEIDNEMLFVDIADFINNITSIDLSEGATLNVPYQQGNVISVFSFQGKFIVEDINYLIILMYLVPYLHTVLLQVYTHSVNKNVSITKREKEVLEFVKIGKTNWEISRILDISERTIKFHLQNVMKKLGVSNRVYAVVMALKIGLIKF